MTPNETATFIPFLQNVTWSNDNNETFYRASSVLPQHHLQQQYLSTNGVSSSNSIPTTAATTTTTMIATTPNVTTNNATANSLADLLSSANLQIPLYATILLLAIVGNTLVIMTLVQNRRMRTITNVFLLNLAVSDILLGIFCMPFTLVGTLLRDFVFGELMCKLLPYLQASSVSVSAWTLVAISVERFYAICHPLKSRRWQTLSHAYKLIVLIWCGSLLFMSPIAVLSRLIPTSQGHHKCREDWPENSSNYERAYNLFLDGILLVVPLIMLAATYSLITQTLWQGMRTEKVLKKHLAFDSTQSSNNLVEVYINSQGTPSTRCPSSCHHQSRENISWHQIRGNCSHESSMVITSSAKKHSPGLRRTNAEKSLQNKKRVIQMLFVVVLEFFICWTPLYIINTIALFNPQIVYQTLGYTTITYFQLLAYSSSCCNPITYCFMNRGFRKAFLNLFRCFKRFHEPRRMSIGGVGAPSATVIVGNGATQYSESEVQRFQTQRARPDCGTELNVLNYMHSVKQSTTPTSFSKSINNDS